MYPPHTDYTLYLYSALWRKFITPREEGEKKKGLFIEPHPPLRERSHCLAHTMRIGRSVKSEIVTGRWRGSSANLRLASLKMNQGQMKDLSGDQMNS